MIGKVLGPRIEPAIVTLQNGYVVKLHSKYSCLCQYTCTALNFGWRRFFLQQPVQKFITIQSDENKKLWGLSPKWKTFVNTLSFLLRLIEHRRRTAEREQKSEHGKQCCEVLSSGHEMIIFYLFYIYFTFSKFSFHSILSFHFPLQCTLCSHSQSTPSSVSD